ncbi:histidine kinase [Crocinitomicaceae bacterium CZZ-1]|uniref:Histidine kinase n=1 Tax=Taishania pollutisoli TaxID=2766479 RepID=A0A8J6U2E1_9FLAO|nr:histidine kinase [Taishania pollutisoli]MBC9812835.1 histidine kinase [Taishania pollutisoli]
MRYLLFLVAFFYCFFTFSQRSFFKAFSTSEGLAQSQVTSICQDSIGYLWIGTLGGISRYNGNTFTNYSTDNGLLNNRVNVIKWINAKLHIGHQGGISIMENNKIQQFPLDKEFNLVNVTDVVCYNGTIVIATNGEGLFQLKNKKLVRIPLLHDDHLFVRDLLEWKGDLYIATRGGVIRTDNLKTTTVFLENKEVSISSLAVLKNNLLISTFYNGLYYYNKELNKIIDTKFETEGHLFNHILVDSRNYVWISTSNGLIKFNEKEYAFIDNSVGLPFNMISTAFEDSDQNMWLGTQGKGLVKAAHGNIFYFDQSTGLPSDIILSGFQTKDGQYYFGTMDKGVIKTRDFKTFQVLPINPTVWCAIADIDGKNWFGTKYGLYAIDKNDQYKVYNLEDGAPGFKITAFYKIDAKSMYIGGSHGIVKYKEGEFIPIGSNGASIGTIRNIEYYNRTLIVGTDMGLFQLSKSNRFELIGQLNRTVYSLAKTSSNRLFMGTEDGLYELQQNNQIVRIRFSSDVASNYINFLKADDAELLVGTNNGVYIIDTKKGERNVKRIAPSDGLIDPETNLNSSFIDKSGKLWFGTASGLVLLDLEQFNRKREHVNLRLEKILLNYEAFDYTAFGGKIKRGIPQHMRFPYNKNNLQFYLDGVALNNYEDLSFQFKLEGLDDTWMPASKTAYITLSGLPAGSYTLHARALMEDGSVVDQITISFIVNEAFFRTWWFLTLIILILSIAIYSWFRVKIKREQEKNELERTAFKARLVTLEQQSLNASMNRHFIFNSLNSIQYFINISDKLSANKYLTSFAKLIRKNLDSSTEENSMVTLAEELERIKLYLALESMRFKDKFDYEIETNHVDLESFLIPAMMIQPFVENSIIHGILPKNDSQGKIKIEIKEIDDYLSIKIIDNGIGIEKSISEKYDYDGDHRSQGMEITVKRIDLIQKISGREMDLSGPNQIQDENGNILGTIVEIKISLNNLDN